MNCFKNAQSKTLKQSMKRQGNFHSQYLQIEQNKNFNIPMVYECTHTHTHTYEYIKGMNVKPSKVI
jgi:hypothetical protein